MTEYPMSDSPESNLLSACRMEIEQSWNDGHGDDAVRRLALAHPGISRELYQFYASVIRAETHLDRHRPEFAEMDRRARDLIKRSSQSAQPSDRKTFLALIRDASDEHVNAISAAMEVPPDFLVDASDNGIKLPPRAREEFVRRLRRVRLTRDIDDAEALASFDAPAKLRRAASRRGPYRHIEVTYRDVVERSSMSDEQKRYWLELG
jgi:hypothetical protein